VIWPFSFLLSAFKRKVGNLFELYLFLYISAVFSAAHRSRKYSTDIFFYFFAAPQAQKVYILQQNSVHWTL